MLKKILVLTIMLLFALQGAALAQTGQVILEDVIYGAAIGGLLGGAIYLLDQDDFGEKVGTGVAVGAIAGFVVGVADTRSFVEVEKDEIKVAMPAVKIERQEEGVRYSADLVKFRF